LKRAIHELQDENEVLHSNQMTLETQIRDQVAVEMAESSMQLLQQIEELRQQLREQQSGRQDVTKSVKKLKQEAKFVHQQDTEKDLAEAEEEIERLKTSHAKELSTLVVDNEQLSQQLHQWKQKFELSQKELSDQKHLVKMMQVQLQDSSLAAGSDENMNAANTAISATKFSQRMDRDQRFRRSDDSENSVPIINLRAQAQVAAAQRAASPVRSPLSTLRNDANSPIRLDTLTVHNQSQPLKHKPRKNSGNKNNNAVEGEENVGPTTYPTRSRVIRA
jgi:hypothetical protein